ncbi:hypothetical protein [Halarsenatibacter silvermanii]|uniref:Uncharacterized protein n=1 Tax=Halarsenatibacter silvermanii TaxID=321763 RepID=A0A1G9HQH8_9FIRM|nr:hypothetical protein [Halarsenatibacter silvermanii]SDL15257.1 hypothetical protein SAMN04488692_1028 [Halarsenatibacter silvermanii]
MSRTIRRPKSDDGILPPGVYTGELVSVKKSEYPSDFHDSGKRDALDMEYELSDKNGNSGTVMDYPSENFRPRSKLRSVLKGLGEMPEEGEDLDLDDLEGTKVRVIIEIDEKRNGEKYNKVVSVKKREDDDEDARSGSGIQ